LKGIFEDEIEEVHLAQDDFRRIQIIERTGHDKFPLVFVHGQSIGTVSDLEDWIVSGKIDSLLEQAYTTRQRRSRADSLLMFKRRLEDVKQQKQLLEQEIERAQQQERFEIATELQTSISQLDKDLTSLSNVIRMREAARNSKEAKQKPKEPNEIGIMDLVLDTGKWAVDSVSSGLSYVASYFTWTSANRLGASPKEVKNEKAGFLEFDVIQINWYWRQQKRTLRFLKDQFVRLNPDTKELRAVHKYENIQKVTVTGKTFFTISFSDDSKPEYYQSTDTAKILDVLLAAKIPLTHITEAPK
jgi:hypothetical protein